MDDSVSINDFLSVPLPGSTIKPSTKDQSRVTDTAGAVHVDEINNVPLPEPKSTDMKPMTTGERLHDYENFADTAIAKGIAGFAGLPQTIGGLMKSPTGEPTKEGTEISPGVKLQPDKTMEMVGDILHKHWPSAADVYKKLMQGVDIGPVTNKDTAPGIHIHPTERKPQGAVEEAIAGGLENVGPAVMTGGGMAIPFVAGALGNIAEKIAPKHPGLANFITQVVSAAGLTGAAKTIKSTTGILSQAGREEDVVKRLAQSADTGPATPPVKSASGIEMPTDARTPAERLAQNLEPKNAPELVPNSKPTTADVLNNRNVRREEERLQGDTAKDMLTMRRQEQTAARDRAIDNATPHEFVDKKGGDEAVKEFITSRADEFEKNAATILEQHAQTAAEKIKAMGEGISPEETGRILREEFETGLKAAKAHTKSKFEAVDPNGEIALNIEPVQRAAKAANKEFFGTGSLEPSAQWGKTLDILNERPYVSYRTLQNLRSTASKMAKDNAGSQEGAAWTRLKSEIDNRINESAASYKEALDVHNTALKRPREALTPKQRLEKDVAGNFTPEQAARYEQARSARIEQGEKYQKGPIGQIGVKKPTGEYKVPDEQIAATILNNKNKATTAAQVEKTFGGNEKAETALREAAVKDLHDPKKGIIKDDGTLDADKYQKWLDTHENFDHLSGIPAFKKLSEQLRDVKSAQAMLDDVARNIAESRDKLNKSVAGKFLKLDADKAVDSVLISNRGRQEMAQLVATVRKDTTGRALQGLRRAIFDRAKVSLEDPQSFKKWLDDHEKVIAPALEPEHLKTLRNIATDIERSLAPGKIHIGPEGGFTAAGLITRLLSEGTANWLWMKGHPFASIVSSWTPFLKTSGARLEQMFARALVDPEYARTLALKVTNQNAKGVARRFGRQMRDLGNISRQVAIASAAASAPKSEE